MTRPDERRFVTFPRGYVRDNIILTRFRNVLRQAVNPDTGFIFTEDEITYITQEGSRFWVEADAIDLFGQSVQARAEWFADQVRAERASSEFLASFHGALWLPNGKLNASGGGGTVTAFASTGTTYVGSTTIGDAGASIARDPNGKRYQVRTTVVVGVSGAAELTMVGIDGGDATNLAAGTTLTWVNPPIGSAPTATVLTQFSGGFPAENDADFAKRIVDRIRFKPGAGNSPQFMEWARSSSVAVEYAFVYACALHAGSTVVVPVQKRGGAIGPTARIPSATVLNTVTGFLTPPASTVVPPRVHVLVMPPFPAQTNLRLNLGMAFASSNGWRDSVPWPMASDVVGHEHTVVTTVVSQTDFTFHADKDRDGVSNGTAAGASLPALAIWNEDTSSFVELDVLTLTNVGSRSWHVTLAVAPAVTIQSGSWVSPANAKGAAIAEALQNYFDSLGPGELIASDDVRFNRAARFPPQSVAYPSRLGQTIIARIDDWLGGSLPVAELTYSSRTTPTPPGVTSLTDGPALLVLGNVSIYSMTL